MSSAVRDVDRGYAALLHRVVAMRRPVLEVGILDGDRPHGSGGATVGEVAEFNEFGTANIESRSFIRAWFDEAEPQMRANLQKLMVSVVAGKRTADQALEILGLQAVGGMQQRISDGIAPPNRPSTVAKKGSDTPLIDSGQLRAAISHRVSEE